jgi:hypothetical protein
VELGKHRIDVGVGVGGFSLLLSSFWVTPTNLLNLFQYSIVFRATTSFPFTDMYLLTVSQQSGGGGLVGHLLLLASHRRSVFIVFGVPLVSTQCVFPCCLFPAFLAVEIVLLLPIYTSLEPFLVQLFLFWSSSMLSS